MCFFFFLLPHLHGRSASLLFGRWKGSSPSHIALHDAACSGLATGNEGRLGIARRESRSHQDKSACLSAACLLARFRKGGSTSLTRLQCVTMTVVLCTVCASFFALVRVLLVLGGAVLRRTRVPVTGSPGTTRQRQGKRRVRTTHRTVGRLPPPRPANQPQLPDVCVCMYGERQHGCVRNPHAASGCDL